MKGITMTAGFISQDQKIIRCIIGHRIPFHISPNILNRIKFGSIGGQIFRMNFLRTLDIKLHFFCSVGQKAIPQQDHWALELP